MSYFKSDIVQQEMREIEKLQEKVYKSVFLFPAMSKEDKIEHIEMMEDLLKRQRIFYTRLTLSDDPDAVKMKENIISQAKQLGFPPDVNLDYVFSNMVNMIENMKKSLNNS